MKILILLITLLSTLTANAKQCTVEVSPTLKNYEIKFSKYYRAKSKMEWDFSTRGSFFNNVRTGTEQLIIDFLKNDLLLDEFEEQKLTSDGYKYFRLEALMALSGGVCSDSSVNSNCNIIDYGVSLSEQKTTNNFGTKFIKGDDYILWKDGIQIFRTNKLNLKLSPVKQLHRKLLSLGCEFKYTDETKLLHPNDITAYIENEEQFKRGNIANSPREQKEPKITTTNDDNSDNPSAGSI